MFRIEKVPHVTAQEGGGFGTTLENLRASGFQSAWEKSSKSDVSIFPKDTVEHVLEPRFCFNYQQTEDGNLK